MNYGKTLNLLACFILICISFSCSSPSSPETNENQIPQNTPVVTGIYVTTVERPDGNGEVIGNPAYEVKSINAVPNPFTGYGTEPLFTGTGRPRFRFTHLPTQKAKVVIVRGITLQDAAILNNSHFGVPSAPDKAMIIRTLEKNGPERFCFWDFRDFRGNIVESGYYRAYFFGEGVPEGCFVDIALNFISDKYIGY